jgi:hypothetical protein
MIPIEDALNIPEKPKTDTTEKQSDMTLAKADAQKKTLVDLQNAIEKAGYDPDALQSDIDAARNNISQAISAGIDALENALNEAKSSGHHLAYGAVAEILNAVSGANYQLVDLHNLGKKARKPYEKSGALQQQYNTEGGGTTHITNQSVFVGTTKELQETLQKIVNTSLPDARSPSTPDEKSAKHDQYARIINQNPEMLIKEKVENPIETEETDE